MILNKYKIFMMSVDNLLENVPRRDFYFKDKIKETCYLLLEYILKTNYETNLDKLLLNQSEIKSKIAMLDFMLERLWLKKYINEKCVTKLGNELIEINRMSAAWVNGLIDNAS